VAAQDVGHTLVLGATGSGKGFLLNFLITHAQKYAPQTVVLDTGHSYRKLATLLGGRYLELGLRQHGVTINPFALEPTAEHLHFLHAFGGAALPADAAQDSLVEQDEGSKLEGRKRRHRRRPAVQRLGGQVEGSRGERRLRRQNTMQS
jgi:type IV secretory pathway VirB4 component